MLNNFNLIIYIIILINRLSFGNNNQKHFRNHNINSLKNIYLKKSSDLIVSKENLINNEINPTIFTRLDLNSNNKFSNLNKHNFINIVNGNKYLNNHLYFILVDNRI
jgi:hypothetical protein